VAARSKAWVCGRSLAGISGSNFAGCMSVYLSLRAVCCATGWSLVKRSHTKRCVSECNREASTMRRPWPTGGLSIHGERGRGRNHHLHYDFYFMNLQQIAWPKQLGSTDLVLQGFIIIFVFGTTAPSGPGPPHSRGFLDHAQRRTTVGRIPLNEWSARRRDLYLTTHDTHNKHPCPRWNSNPQSQQASDRRPTP
jgi:hypothetical protein